MSGLGTLVYTSFLASLSPLLLLAVIALLVMRGRGPEDHPGPMSYFFYGVALACIIVGVFAAAVTVHSVASLVGPTPNTSGGISSSSVVGQATTGTIPDFSSTGNSNSFISTDVVSSSVTNQYTSDSVAAGLFLVIAVVGFLLVWPRALRETNRPAAVNLAVRYSYFVAGLSALALLVLVPLAADNVFRAIAPGVTAAPSHADGVRNLFTFSAVSGLLAVILGYHLRYATRLRAEPIPPTRGEPSGSDDGDYFQQP